MKRWNNPSIRELVQREVSPSDSVLELGCGVMQGILEDPDNPRITCGSLSGVDLYRPYLPYLNRKGVAVVQADLRKFTPFKDRSFDVVLLLDTLEHLEFRDAVFLLREAERVARKKVIVLTPRDFKSNIEHIRELGGPYSGLGANILQLHQSVISRDVFVDCDYRVRKYRKLHWFAVKKKQLRILHVWDQAGVAALMAREQNRLGHFALVVKNKAFDGLKHGKFYGNEMLDYTPNGGGWFRRQYWRLPENIRVRMRRGLRVLRRMTDALRFYITVSRLTKHFDILHIHHSYRILLFCPLKPKIIEFHGDDARRSLSYQNHMRRVITRLFLWLFHRVVTFYVSTPDLLPDVQRSEWIANPADRELFHPSKTDPRKGSALYFHNWYETATRARTLARENGWDLTVVERFRQQGVPYREMPLFMGQFEFFIDRERIASLSKTALEALALGLKVVRWDNQIIEGFPDRHDPREVACVCLYYYWKKLYEGK